MKESFQPQYFPLSFQILCNSVSEFLPPPPRLWGTVMDASSQDSVSDHHCNSVLVFGPRDKSSRLMKKTPRLDRLHESAKICRWCPHRLPGKAKKWSGIMMGIRCNFQGNEWLSVWLTITIWENSFQGCNSSKY